MFDDHQMSAAPPCRTAPPQPNEERRPLLPGMVGNTAPMKVLAEHVRGAARFDFPVLVRGESGTGKELVARAIHGLGARRRGPLVAINGAPLRDDMAMSTLLGHARGAFTGATSRRLGAFAKAHRGTLFLDEVAALRPAVQAQLLRVVEDGRYTPLGSDEEMRVDVRLVTATCEPLEHRVRVGAFRRDLFERLAACRIHVPPLRDRLDDLPMLAAKLMGEGPLSRFSLEPDATEALREHDFPGNVRELRNVLIQAALICQGDRIGAHDLQRSLAARVEPSASCNYLAMVKRCGGNVSAAAREAGIPRSTMRDRVMRLRNAR